MRFVRKVDGVVAFAFRQCPVVALLRHMYEYHRMTSLILIIYEEMLPVSCYYLKTTGKCTLKSAVNVTCKV
jgi:hypothetical protein